MNNENTYNSTSQKASYLFGIFLFGALALYLLLSVILNAPMLASDEYVYFISGKYLDSLTNIYQFDPYLQKTANLLYFKITQMIFAIFNDKAILGLRLLHIFEYALTAIILYKTFEKEFDKSSLRWGCVAFCILPSSLYIYTVMPEIELIFLGSCFMYAILILLPRSSVYGSLVAGSIVGIAILVKPHAIAMVACGILIFSIYPFLSPLTDKRIKGAVVNVTLFLAFTYIVFILLWRLCSSEWSFDPRAPLGLSFYGRYMGTETLALHERLLGVFKYMGIHSIVLYLIFAPVFFYTARCILEYIRQPLARESSFQILFSIFILSFVFIHIVMISYFTFNAGLQNEGESLRIHGRYLSTAICFLTFMYFAAAKRIRGKSEIFFWISSIFAVFVFVCVIGYFKIFPWDYPLLFAFFNPQNNYGWNFGGSISGIHSFLIAFMLLGGVGVLLNKKWRAAFIHLQLFVILILASVQTYNWLFSHLSANKNISNTGNAVARAFTSDHPGSGIVITSERYGKASYLLFNMANAPKVLVKNAGENILDSDVDGMQWVMTTDPYVTKFSYRNKLTINGYDFYLINSPITISGPNLRTLGIGENIQLRLGSVESSNLAVTGFNETEEWGRWSAEENVEVQLPVKINGRIRLKIYGWMLPDNKNKIVELKIGEVKSSLLFSDTASIHDIEINLNSSTDKLYMHSSISIPNNSHRSMGFALSYINIESLSAAMTLEK